MASFRLRNDRFNIYGNNGSPYSCKIRSYFRYKRISFNWHQGINWSASKFEKIKPKVIPVIEYPNNGILMNESTKIIQKFESEYTNRSVFISPSPSSLQFLCNFLEDFADEWVTKLMFGMRWNRKLDQDSSSLFLMLNATSMSVSAPKMATYAKKRQVERTDLVGCSNDEFMHYCLHQILSILQNHFKKGNVFLFGTRPSNADFAIYGQIKQFVVDPTSDRIVRAEYPYILAWIAIMDDLSGVNIENDNGWITLDNIMNNKQNNVIRELLKVCGDIYLPFLKANYDAFMKKEKRFSVRLLMENKYKNIRTFINHKQPTFKWQVRCYKTLQKQLEETLQVATDTYKLIAILKDANCYDLLMDNMQSKL
eukprot:259480_1